MCNCSPAVCALGALAGGAWDGPRRRLVSKSNYKRYRGTLRYGPSVEVQSQKFPAYQKSQTGGARSGGWWRREVDEPWETGVAGVQRVPIQRYRCSFVVMTEVQ